MTSKEKALSLAESVRSQKGIDVRVLDLRGVASFTDLFVLATATSDRHARTLTDAVVECARKLGESPLGIEGLETSRWILVDLGDVIVHVFLEDVRAYYDLERLWDEAELVDLERAAGARP